MFCSNTFSKKICLFLFCYLCYIFGFAIFFNGMVSSSTSKLQPIPSQDVFNICTENIREDECILLRDKLGTFYSNHYQKVIIMIIDAFRADFISSIKSNAKFNLSMPFTEILLKNGSAISFVTRGFAPTVTLPRIKTLVTGTISNFLDILLNFNAVELFDDNILKQASLSGLKSVFYGDNTWLKLFPNLFIRSEGTHSFYVSDFKEVDLNVSRHIKYEIANEDWNILILHFLGVDHIGHTYGPFSEHLSPKLKEMDEIIKYMYENIKSIFHFPSLIVICGDHGMTTSGGHGGTTEEELLTPLIFIDTAGHQINTKYQAIVDQVDFAPTLSTLLGLPIPVNSFGKIISDVLLFAGFSTEQVLCAEYYNFLQISSIYKKYFPSVSKHLHFTRETIENHYKWLQMERNDTVNNSSYTYLLRSYETLLTNMKNDLLGISTGYNEFSMMLGLVIMWVCLLLSIHILWPLDLSESKIYKILVDNRFYVSSFLIITICISFMHSSIIVIPLLISILIFISELTFLLFNHTDKDSIIFTGKFCILFLLIHALSLFSSSYIEEEHQTWYYFTCSITILLCYKRLFLYLNIWLRNNSTYNLWIFWKESYSIVFCTISILILHCVFCKWNQVGNKWQHVFDISDWLNQEENVIYLGILIVTSQIILMFYFKKKLSSLSYIIFFMGLVCITLQKLNNSGLYSYFNDYTKTMLMPWAIYVFSVLLIISLFIQIYTSIFLSGENVKAFMLHLLAAWILLVEIIGRAHNIPLIAVVITQEFFLSKVLWTENYSITYNALYYFIIGMASFSYYGNSNSLSSIDVVTGYTGVLSYRPVIVAFLLFCNTYSTMVMWLVLIPYRTMHLNHVKDNFKYLAKKIKYTFLILLNYKLFVLSLYCIIMYLMRHHLFIYSVFFPKLFWEFCHVIMISIICLLISVIFIRA